MRACCCGRQARRVMDPPVPAAAMVKEHRLHLAFYDGPVPPLKFFLLSFGAYVRVAGT